MRHVQPRVKGPHTIEPHMQGAGSLKMDDSKLCPWVRAAHMRIRPKRIASVNRSDSTRSAKGSPVAASSSVGELLGVVEVRPPLCCGGVIVSGATTAAVLRLLLLPLLLLVCRT